MRDSRIEAFGPPTLEKAEARVSRAKESSIRRVLASPYNRESWKVHAAFAEGVDIGKQNAQIDLGMQPVPMPRLLLP